MRCGRAPCCSSVPRRRTWALPTNLRPRAIISPGAAAEHMKDDESVRTLAADETFIDAGDDVRDVLLLAIPMRRVCADYRDNPACGAAIPDADSLRVDTDPRWDALRSLAADGTADGDGSSDDES